MWQRLQSSSFQMSQTVTEPSESSQQTPALSCWHSIVRMQKYDFNMTRGICLSCYQFLSILNNSVVNIFPFAWLTLWVISSGRTYRIKRDDRDEKWMFMDLYHQGGFQGIMYCMNVISSNSSLRMGSFFF